MYELQGSELRSAFESLHDSVTALQGTNKPEPLTTAVVELDEQGQVVVGLPHPEKPVLQLTKSKDAVFSTKPFRLHDGSHVNITVLGAKGLISMPLSEPN